jgi:hypothetical protein
VIILTGILFLSGCGGTDRPTINDTVQKLNANKKLNQYVISSSFENRTKDEENGMIYFDLEMRANEEFDSLTKEKKVEIFNYVNNLVSDLNCDIKGFECSVDNIIFNTDNHTYEQFARATIDSYYEDDQEILLTEEVSEPGGVEPEVVEETVTVEAPLEVTLSQDFLEYNQKYYTAYKNSLDLIGSNFELIADGFGTPNLIDDLIVWTNEFNELLDVYGQNAIPSNEVDKNLYSITTEMISKQREANNYILNGLDNYDEQSIVIAGEYLDSIVDLYLNGNALINN